VPSPRECYNAKTKYNMKRRVLMGRSCASATQMLIYRTILAFEHVTQQ